MQPEPSRDLIQKIRRAARWRYLEVVGSIYLYNEHRGYTSLDRVLEAAKLHCPAEQDFIAAIAKHRADERKHYLMFKRWFELAGRMPIAVDASYGHIDRFITRTFGCGIDALDTSAIVADRESFEKLCRVILLTERRGLAQVEDLLRHPLVLSDRVMHRIFRTVHKDEPDHFLPYADWLERQGRPTTFGLSAWPIGASTRCCCSERCQRCSSISAHAGSRPGRMQTKHSR